MSGDLTPKQDGFCHQYIKDRNATKAAERAGYSVKSAQVIGCTLLKHPKVAAKIASLSRPIEKKSALSAERVIAELSNLAFFDPASMYDEHGKLLAIKDMPEETRRAITSIEEGVKSTKIKSASKLGSLELAAKLLGMVKQEQTQQQAIQIIIAAPPQAPVVSSERPLLLPEWE